MAGAGGIHVGGGAIVIMDPPPFVYAKVFHPASGPDRHLKQKVEAVAILARSLAPVGETGMLRAGITADRNRTEKGRYAFGYSVGTPVYYAHFVHEGTGPSPRWPNSGKVMKFPGNEISPVYRDFVMHPGTPAQPFLQNALVAMVG